MTNTAVTKTEPQQLTTIQETITGVVESVLISGDLSKLTSKQRVDYYQNLCKSLNLNPLSRPFDYVTLKGKLTLYAKKDATDQIRRTLDISQKFLAKRYDKDTGIYEVGVESRLPNGRTDEATAFLHIGGYKGEELANALMKCETKAKRRGTLAIAGLGFMDETEVSDVKEARFIDPDAIELEIAQLEAAKAEDKKTIEVPKEEPKPRATKKEPAPKSPPVEAVTTPAPAQPPAAKAEEPAQPYGHDITPNMNALNFLKTEAYRKHMWQPSELTEIIQLTFGKPSGLQLNMPEYNKLMDIVTKFDFPTAKKNIQEAHARQLQDAAAQDVNF